MGVMRRTVGTALRPAGRLGALAIALAVLVVGVSSSSAAGSESDGWIYLRGGEPPAADEQLVEILAVGDIMTGRGLAGVKDVFAHVSETLRTAALQMQVVTQSASRRQGTPSAFERRIAVRGRTTPLSTPRKWR